MVEDGWILVLTFRALNGQAPQYITDLLSPHVSGQSLWSSGQNFIKVPKICGDLSFQALAPKLWNALPASLRVANSFDSFKKQPACFYSNPTFTQPVSLHVSPGTDFVNDYVYMDTKSPNLFSCFLLFNRF